MKYIYNYKYLLVVLIVIVIFYFQKSLVDGFENITNTINPINNVNDRNTITNINNNDKKKWSNDLIRRFNYFQKTVNDNNYEYDLDIIQQQATPEEAEGLLKNGYWYWPDELKSFYIKKIWENPIIKIDPGIALSNDMKIYNQRAMTEKLAWNTKEGEFLLYGLITNKNKNINGYNNDTIKCKDGVLEKSVFTGMNLWNGATNNKITKLKPEDIPNEVKGFSFVSNACNPCLAIDGDFSCPFKLEIDKKDDISKPWITLWGLDQ